MTETATENTGPSRDELRAHAKALGIAGYGSLTKAQLAEAIAGATDASVPQPRELRQAPVDEAADTGHVPLEALQARAAALDVDGRSSMDADELVAAIAAAEANLPPRTPGQVSAAGVSANTRLGEDPPPGTPEEVGRPDLLEVALERGKRTPFREIGA